METKKTIEEALKNLTEEERATAEQIEDIITGLEFTPDFDDLAGLCFQLTAYESGGTIDTEQAFIDLFITPYIDEMRADEIVTKYNNYLSLNNYETYERNDDETLNEIFKDPAEAIRATYYGNYKYNDDYFKFNGYGNLESFDEYDITAEAESDYDFKKYLLDEEFFEIQAAEIEELLIKLTTELVKKGY